MTNLFRTASFIAVFALLASGTSSYAQNRTMNEEELAMAADKIHSKYLTIDTHNDAALHINNPNGKYGVTKGQVSFPMMREGGLDAAFFAIFVNQGPRDIESLQKVREWTENELKKFLKYASEQEGVRIATTPAALEKNKKEGYISVVPAIENGYPIGKDLSLIKYFHDLGVVAITLCHNKNNDICDASMDTAPEHNGLSPFGEKVVKEMNRLGIAIDLSHASTATLFDVVKLSKQPVIATHSGVWSIKNHNRNLKDEEIKAIAENGGLIQVATGRFFLSDRPKEEVTVKDIADHVDYVVKLAGIDHTGLGTDFDGGGGVVGLENVSKMKNLTIELLRRGYSEEDLAKFWGKNLVNFLKKIQK